MDEESGRCVDDVGESWYCQANSATDSLSAYLGRKGAQTGAEQLSTATPNAAKELTAFDEMPVWPLGTI